MAYYLAIEKLEVDIISWESFVHAVVKTPDRLYRYTSILVRFSDETDNL